MSVGHIMCGPVAVIAFCVLATSLAATAPPEAQCGQLPGHVTPEGVRGHHLPWLVRIVSPVNGVFRPRCVGTLISPQVLLTAAHCIRPQGTAKIEMTECNADSLCHMPLYFNISSVVTHPAYSPLDARFINDIALVKLDKAVHSQGGYVCLPQATFSSSSLLGSTLVVAAFNIHQKGTPIDTPAGPSAARAITVKPLSDSDCQRHLGDMVSLHNSHLCAKGEHDLETCWGDSAAPMHSLQGSPPRAVFAGFVTFGSPRCADAHSPTVYTNVGAHLQWIKDTLRTLQ